MKNDNDIPRMQDIDFDGLVVLMRVDHNVVKKGKIKDTTRIDATIPTILNIIRKGGHLILMSHVGRPKDKKTGNINISDDTSVQAIVDYFRTRFGLNFVIPECPVRDERGILAMDTAVNHIVYELVEKSIDGIYLPNTRWFAGEEADDHWAEQFGDQLAGLADIYINDAFGSWQPHVSTTRPADYIPAYAGLLMQKEIKNLEKIMEPEKPFLGVVAGSKFDTKIGPLQAILEKADHLILGGIIYNAYLCAKYNIKIKGITEEDLVSAREFVAFSEKYPGKIIEPEFIVESDTLDGKIEGKHRTHNFKDVKELNYVLDIDPKSFDNEEVKKIILEAKTIFTNAVMGLTPHFYEGTERLYTLIKENTEADKLFGGGDTIQEFKALLPDTFIKSADNPKYYFFSGGGTILKAIKEGSALGLAPIQALVENKKAMDTDEDDEFESCIEEKHQCYYD